MRAILVLCYNKNMKKKALILYYIILMLFCPALNVGAVPKAEVALVSDRCESIINSLKKLQKTDAKTRVYLGSYYEKILTNFITPLNVRLVENSLSNADLVENQNDFAETRQLFSSDFINYQRALEELVGMNCKEDSDTFYNKLVIVRQKRKIMEQDTLKMREIISQHIKMVNSLKGKL